MTRPPIPELLSCLQPFGSERIQIALEVRDIVLQLFPGCNELVYDSYNALAIAYSTTESQKDAFCHIAVYKGHINLGFNNGVSLNDPEGRLKGTGTAIRHISITTPDEVPKHYVQNLLQQAYELSISSVKDRKALHGKSIMKSSAPIKKRPGK